MGGIHLGQGPVSSSTKVTQPRIFATRRQMSRPCRNDLREGLHRLGTIAVAMEIAVPLSFWIIPLADCVPVRRFKRTAALEQPRPV